jgi:predicted DNA-binding transcriptional regulator YafY
VKRAQLERFYHLHHRLRRPGATPHVDELAAELEVSRSTVYRDLETLRDRLHAPLEQAGDGRVRYDPAADDYELPGLWFNESELYALLAAERLLEAVEPGILAPHLEPLHRRIGELLHRTGHDPDTVRERVVLQPLARRGVDRAVFATVAGATLAGRRLELDYRGRAREVAETRRVHPQRLLHYRDNWYLIAYCERAEGLRNFAIDRIRHPRETGEPARILDAEALGEHLQAGFGIFGGPARAVATLEFSPTAARWVAEEQWHPDQVDERTGEGGLRRRLPYSDPTELLMEAGRWGPDCTITDPPELRRAAADRLRRAAAQYDEE